jgi:hypothetical protein
MDSNEAGSDTVSDSPRSDASDTDEHLCPSTHSRRVSTSSTGGATGQSGSLTPSGVVGGRCRRQSCRESVHWVGTYVQRIAKEAAETALNAVIADVDAETQCVLLQMQERCADGQYDYPDLVGEMRGLMHTHGMLHTALRALAFPDAPCKHTLHGICALWAKLS